MGLLCALTGIRQRLPLEGEMSVSNRQVQSLSCTIFPSDVDALSGTFQKVLSLPPSWYEWVHWPLKWDALTPIFATHLYCNIHVHIHSHRPWDPASSKWHFVCYQKAWGLFCVAETHFGSIWRAPLCVWLQRQWTTLSPNSKTRPSEPQEQSFKELVVALALFKPLLGKNTSASLSLTLALYQYLFESWVIMRMENMWLRIGRWN